MLVGNAHNVIRLLHIFENSLARVGTCSQSTCVALRPGEMGCGSTKDAGPLDSAEQPPASASPSMISLDGTEELIILCDTERCGALEGFYARGGNPNIRCTNTEYTTTMLVYAATANKIRVVDLLLSQTSIDVNMGDEMSNTALILSAWKGNEEVVAMLLQHPGIDVNARGFGAQTALCSAVEGGFARQVQQCINAGGNVSLPAFDPEGHELSIDWTNKLAVRALDWPPQSAPRWHSPTRLAHDGQQIECLVVLVANGGDHDGLYAHPLLAAASRGEMAKAKQLLATEGGEAASASLTPLQGALLRGDVQAALPLASSELVELPPSGAAVPLPPLFFAIELGQLELAKQLLVAIGEAWTAPILAAVEEAATSSCESKYFAFILALVRGGLTEEEGPAMTLVTHYLGALPGGLWFYRHPADFDKLEEACNACPVDLMPAPLTQLYSSSCSVRDQGARM